MSLAVIGGSELKRSALQSALRFCGYVPNVIRIDVASREDAQPIGEEDTERGARKRARTARKMHPEADAWFGCENGIRHVKGKTEDWAIVVLILPNGVQIMGASEPVVFPEECVDIALAARDQEKTVGAVLAERYGCDPKDPHAFLSGGRFTREALLRDAFVSILQPFKGSLL